MKLAIMQPYFLPYIGYFQLIDAVDVFVVYDNIKYTKKGWINRNRLLLNGTDTTFTLPLSKGSDSLDVAERTLASNYDRPKLLNLFREAYRRAPHFAEVWPLVEAVIANPQVSLFDYIRDSIVRVCQALNIHTEIIVSSRIDIDHALRGQDKVIALCQCLGATQYINAQGGHSLYQPEAFLAKGIDLCFVRPGQIEYAQYGEPFVPWLSIVDVMMFNDNARRHELVKHRELFR